MEGARRAGACFESVAESGSSTQMLIDSALLDNGVLQDAYAGGWCYRPDATAAADRMHALPQQGSFNVTAGGLVPIRAWTNAPAAGERYMLFALLPPRDQPGQVESWMHLANRALVNMWQVAEFPVGSSGGGANTRWFPVLRAEVVLVAAIVVAGGSGATITAPSGWTSQATVNLSTTLQLRVFTHRARPNDPVEWTFTLDDDRVATGCIVGYLDPNPTSPVDVTASATVTSTAAISAPAVTTTNQNETVLRIVAADVPLTWTPQGTSLQRRFDATLRDGNANQGLAVFDGEQTGTNNGQANTLTGSGAANQIAITLALAIRDSTHRTLFFGAPTLGFTAAAGASSLVLPRPLNVPNDDWVPGVADTRGAFVRRYTAKEDGQFLGQPWDSDLNTRGSWWKLHEDNGDRYLEVSPWTLQTNDLVFLQVQRPLMTLVSDDDETACPLDVFALRIRYELFSYLNAAPATRGKYGVELAQALADWMRAYKTIEPQQAVIGA